MAVDLSPLTELTVQINSWQRQLATVTDPSTKAMIQSQLVVLQDQLANTAQHMQAQVDASNNILTSLGLFATLTSVVGNAAPSIISLFKP